MSRGGAGIHWWWPKSARDVPAASLGLTGALRLSRPKAGIQNLLNRFEFRADSIIYGENPAYPSAGQKGKPMPKNKRNGLVLDSDDLWNAIQDAATVFFGTLKTGPAHASAFSIHIDAEKKKTSHVVTSDTATIRIYSQLASAASGKSRDDYEKLAKGISEDVVAGISAAGTKSEVQLADVMINLFAKITELKGEYHMQSRLLLDDGIPLDSDDSKEDLKDDDKNPIKTVDATLEFGGRFYLTDDDGDCRFDLDATLSSGKKKDHAALHLGKNGKLTTEGTTVTVYHGPGVEKDLDEAKGKPVAGVAPDRKHWYKYAITLEITGAPVTGSTWPLKLDIDIDTYADDDPFGNTTVVTAEELTLTLKPNHG